MALYCVYCGEQVDTMTREDSSSHTLRCMQKNRFRVGVNVLVNIDETQLIGEITQVADDDKIKVYGDQEYDLKIKMSEYSNYYCNFDQVVQIVLEDQKTFQAFQLYKAGSRTQSGTGKLRHILADNLPIAIGKCLDWIREKHPDIEASEIDWKDEPNYKFSEERATTSVVLDSEETIDTGWADRWIDVSVIVMD